MRKETGLIFPICPHNVKYKIGAKYMHWLIAQWHLIWLLEPAGPLSGIVCTQPSGTPSDLSEYGVH